MAGLKRILDAAAAHGCQSDPDHEVGDLQDALRAAWQLMTEGQQAKLLLAVEDQLEWGE